MEIEDEIEIKTDDEPADVVRDALLAYCQHPAAYLALNKDVKIFSSARDGTKGIIAYRDSGRYRFAVGGIIAPRECKPALLDDFLLFSANKKKKIVFVQCSNEDCELFCTKNFSVNQLGSSYLTSLSKFSLAGSRFVKLRNKISQAKRSGIKVNIYGPASSLDATVRTQIKQIDNEWLTKKKAAELSFLIGEIDLAKPLDQDKWLFVAEKDGFIYGYIVYSRTYGKYAGWMHDLTRRRQECAVGVMELINDYAIAFFKNRGTAYLHFGFTPLADLDSKHENDFPGSRAFSSIAKWLSMKGDFIYPMRTQLQYKKKWAPDIQYAEYIAFQNGFSLPGLWQFLRLTNII